MKTASLAVILLASATAFVSAGPVEQQFVAKAEAFAQSVAQPPAGMPANVAASFDAKLSNLLQKAGCTLSGVQVSCPQGMADGFATDQEDALSDIQSAWTDAVQAAMTAQKQQAQLANDLVQAQKTIAAMTAPSASWKTKLATLARQIPCQATGSGYDCSAAHGDLSADLQNAAELLADVTRAQKDYVRDQQQLAAELSDLSAQVYGIVLDKRAADFPRRFGIILTRTGCTAQGTTVDCSKAKVPTTDTTDISLLQRDSGSLLESVNYEKSLVPTLTAELSELAADIPKTPAQTQGTATANLQLYVKEANCSLSGQTANCAKAELDLVASTLKDCENYLYGIRWVAGAGATAGAEHLWINTSQLEGALVQCAQALAAMGQKLGTQSDAYQYYSQELKQLSQWALCSGTTAGFTCDPIPNLATQAAPRETRVAAAYVNAGGLLKEMGAVPAPKGSQ